MWLYVWNINTLNEIKLINYLSLHILIFHTKLFFITLLIFYYFYYRIYIKYLRIQNLYFHKEYKVNIHDYRYIQFNNLIQN